MEGEGGDGLEEEDAGKEDDGRGLGQQSQAGENARKGRPGCAARFPQPAERGRQRE